MSKQSPAPPTAAPSPPVDHAEGQTSREQARRSLQFRLDVPAGFGTPTPAAPAPGREHDESDAAFKAVFNELCSQFKDRSISYDEIENIAKDVIALARTPARTDGGISDAEIKAAAQTMFEHYSMKEMRWSDMGPKSQAGWFQKAREVLEAARAAETAGGAGETGA